MQPRVAVVFGAFGGRFDQEMAAINSLFKWSSVFDRVVLLDGKTVSALLLGPGSHQLRLITAIEGPTCGLIPIAGPVDSVDSTGLVWNIEGRRLEWGVLVSSSNSLDPKAGGIVEVRTSQTLLWTCSLTHVDAFTNGRL
jgi:thiamine pyrophosphokinase